MQVHARPKRKIPESLDDLKAALPALVAEARKARKTVVVVLDGIPELHDYYTPTVLEWLPPLLGDAVVVLSLEKEKQVLELELQAQVDVLIEVLETPDHKPCAPDPHLDRGARPRTVHGLPRNPTTCASASDRVA